jgi:hypothetical protein
LERLFAITDGSNRPGCLPAGNKRRGVASIEMMDKITGRSFERRERFWQTFIRCAKLSTAAPCCIAMVMAFYRHLGALTRNMIGSIDVGLRQHGRAAILNASFQNAGPMMETSHA